MATNEIVSNETVEWETEDGGSIVGVKIAIDVFDLSQAEPFVAEVAEAFLMQRMVSPPESAGLFISVDGKMQPNEFATLWSLAIADNEPIKTFLSQMEFADVMGFMRDDPDQPVGVSLLPKS